MSLVRSFETSVYHANVELGSGTVWYYLKDGKSDGNKRNINDVISYNLDDNIKKIIYIARYKSSGFIYRLNGETEPTITVDDIKNYEECDIINTDLINTDINNVDSLKDVQDYLEYQLNNTSKESNGRAGGASMPNLLWFGIYNAKTIVDIAVNNPDILHGIVEQIINSKN